MLAKAKSPSAGRSVSFLFRLSSTMTREMKDELLLVILFFGFLRLFPSLRGTGTRRALPSPKAGADPRVTDVAGASLIDVLSLSSLLNLLSAERRLSLGCS